MNLPTVHEWNLGIQRELPWGLVMQASYIGRRGERLFMAYNANQINADAIVPSFLIMQQNVAITGCRASGTTAAGAPCGVAPPLLTQLQTQGGLTAAAAATFLNSSTTLSDLGLNAAGNFAGRIEDTTLGLRLRPNQQFNVITYLSNEADSNYHAAQFTLRRRFSSGLALSMAYTFGKSIDNQSVDPVGASSGGGLSTTNSRTPNDIRNFRAERARSEFDRTHVIQAASVWEVPLGKGKRFFSSAPGVVNQILGGWTINSIYTFMTGEPFSVNSGGNSTTSPGGLTSNSGHVSRAVVLTPIKAQLQNLPGVAGPVLFANKNAFAVPAHAVEALFPYGIYTIPEISMVGKTEEELTQAKRFKVQFRMEMFNALNHANFDNPRDASVGSPALSSPVFAQTCCATVAPPSTQTVVQTGESARIIQFALKFLF